MLSAEIATPWPPLPTLRNVYAGVHHDDRPRPLPRRRRDPVHARHFRYFSQPQECDRHLDVDRTDPACRQHQPRCLLHPSRRSRRPGLCPDRAHGSGSRGRYRACYPGRVQSQSRLDRRRRHQPDEGLESAMYQAIVFLPLLGSIIAAFIALAGAHARCPGGSPPTTPQPPRGGGLAGGGASAAPPPAAEPHHDEAHAPEEPPAAGSRMAELVTTVLLFISMTLSWIAFFRVGFGHQDASE